MENEKRAEKNKGLALGLVFGVLFGVAVAPTLGMNTSTGLALFMTTGIALGAAYDRKRKKTADTTS